MNDTKGENKFVVKLTINYTSIRRICVQRLKRDAEIVSFKDNIKFNKLKKLAVDYLPKVNEKKDDADTEKKTGDDETNDTNPDEKHGNQSNKNYQDYDVTITYFDEDGDEIDISSGIELTEALENLKRTSHEGDTFILYANAIVKRVGEEEDVSPLTNIRKSCRNKASAVQFQSEPNVLYTVYINGPSTSGGLFELDIKCVDAPSVVPSVVPTLSLSLLPTPSRNFYFQGPQKITRSEENEHVKIIASPPTDYVLRFVIRPLGIVSDWVNIIHFTTGGKGYGYGTRVPAVWFSPGSTQLHATPGSNSNGNEWQNTVENLALNVDHEVEIKVVGTTSIVSVNGEIKHTMTVGTRSQLLNVKVYIGDPWFSAANAIISDVSFSPAS